MIRKWNVTIERLSKEFRRRIYVYLPTEYEQDPERRFPVLYFFDGQNVFYDADATYGRSWRLGDYLDYTDTPVIVVAIECNSRGNERLKEYSPFSFVFEDCGRLEGKGKIYMDWLVNECKPQIDAEFRTLPDRAHTGICGSSMGGLMALYAISQYNGVFSRAAALSPSVWISRKNVLDFLRHGRYESNTVVYLDYGSKEIRNHRNTSEAFRMTVDFFLERNINVSARIVKGGAHNEASWEKCIPVFMKCLGF